MTEFEQNSETHVDQDLHDAAQRVLACGDQAELLQVVIDVLCRGCWRAVSVCTHLDRTLIRRAHRGLTEQESASFDRHEPDLHSRRVLFGIEFEPYRAGRCYFIPGKIAAADPAAAHSLHRWPVHSRSSPESDHEFACIALYNSNSEVIGSVVLARLSGSERPSSELVSRLEFFTELVSQRIETLRLTEESHFAADALQRTVRGIAGLTGERFFLALAQHIAAALGVRYVVVSATLDGEPTRMRVLGAWMNGQPGAPLEYGVESRPCELTLRDGYLFCGARVQNEYPDDDTLRELGVESYLGVALRSRDGNVMGSLCVLDTEPMTDNPTRTCILEIFALRAAAELERQLSDRELLESELRFRKMVEAIPTGIAVFTDGKIVYANAEIARILGVEVAESMLAAPVSDLFPADDRGIAAELIGRLERPGGKVDKTDVKLIRRDGDIVEAEVFGIHVDYRGAPSGQIMVYDVTKRNRTTERLVQRERELTHVARLSMMGEMVAGIIHDITQPLSAISNYAGACQATLRQFDLAREPRGPKLEEWMNSLSDAANRAGELIDRLRSFVRKTDPQRRVCNLDRILRESIELISYSAQRQQVQLSWSSSHDRPIEVAVDPVQIQQVLVNLLSNACESFGDDFCGSRRVELVARVENGLACVAVRDNGGGIAPESRDQIFEPFFTNKNRGMGMGLAICRTIVESHGGTLSLVSEVGEPTEFQFSVPLAGPSVLLGKPEIIEQGR